jgi:putative ABC transport system ATP-binding protein
VSSLEFREVVKHYPCGDGEVVKAVDGISLTIAAGEFVALYGPSGSGKTTLLLMAGGLLAPDSGSVLFAGEDIARYSPHESSLYRRRELGVVFQSFHLVLGASALENAALKLLADGWTMDEACAAARPWLERVGLGGRAERAVERLSTGERQRVAIARALVNEPHLLLADEPTGNLDSQRGRQTLALLREICRERMIPILLVTHDPQASMFVDRVCTLRDGALSDGLDVDLAGVFAQ